MNTSDTHETNTTRSDHKLQASQADLHTRLARLLSDASLSAEQKDALAQQTLSIVCGEEAKGAA